MVIRLRRIKDITEASRQSEGFALPTILISSIIMLTVLIVAISSTVAVRNALQAGYYDNIAEAAADAGVAYAKACLAQNNNIPLWTDAKPLTPATDCSGNLLGSSTPIQVLVVGGGGGGGGNCNSCGGAGGGGAGGLIYNPSFMVSVGSTAVTVAAGGTGGAKANDSSGNGANGNNSSFGSITAIGGGGGRPQSGATGGSGGSGGGGSGGGSPAPGAGGSGTEGQGNAGASGGGSSAYRGGGGGGSGSSATTDGGAGTAYSITGSSIFYAGGGGGGAYSTNTPGVGGSGSGGNGANQSTNGGNGYPGATNTGGGGGGAAGSTIGGVGGSGAGGVVIVSYPTGSLTATGGTITTSGGNTIHKFISNGTFTVTGVATPTCPEDDVCKIVTSDNMRSSFSVNKPQIDVNGKALNLTSLGAVDILRTSTQGVWRTYKHVSNATLTGIISGNYVNSPSVGQTNFSSTYGYTGIQPASCPTGFIPVPGSRLYDTDNGFCVMKYEAKNVGGIATSVASGTPWVNITQSEMLVSQGKSATSSIITDGNLAAGSYYQGAVSGLASVTVDLGSVMNINSIINWHYYTDYRTYYNTKTEVSTDNTNWTTVFDSAVSGTYMEAPSGHTITFAPTQVRYIRDWLNGSTSNASSHWVEIQAFTPDGSAVDLTSKACVGCHLITDNEWLTIASNIANQNNNWSGGVMGSGYVYSGHNDNAPASNLAADGNDANGYSGTGQVSGNQRRTLSLSNGEVIWDFSGNASEWTNGMLYGDKLPGRLTDSAYGWEQWNDSGLIMNGLPETYQPGYGTAFQGLASSTQGIGQLYTYYKAPSTLQAFRRGGARDSTVNAGIWSLSFSTSVSQTDSYVSFRAVR